MAWSSLLSASRHLSMVMRTRTPKTAFLKFQQYKRLLSDRGPNTSSSNAGGVTPSGVKDGVMAALGPAAEQTVNYAKAHPEIGFVLAGTASAATTYFVWAKLDKKKGESGNIVNSIALLQEKATLVSNKTAETVNLEGAVLAPKAESEMPAFEPEMVPCVSCAVPCFNDETIKTSDSDANEDNEGDMHSITSVLTSALQNNDDVVAKQNKLEEQGLLIPLTVGQENPGLPVTPETMQNNVVPEEAKCEENELETEPSKQAATNRRRRHGKPSSKDDPEE